MKTLKTTIIAMLKPVLKRISFLQYYYFDLVVNIRLEQHSSFFYLYCWDSSINLLYDESLWWKVQNELHMNSLKIKWNSSKK